MYTAANWAETFIDYLDLVNWEIFKIIILDYNLNFFLDL